MRQRLTLHDAPAAGFDEPFAMLEACHERVQRSLALLARLVDHVRAHGADAQASSAAADVLRYFDLAAPHHHEDEERHVFPRLLASGDAGLVEAVTRLQADHHAMAGAWAVLRMPLQRWARGEGTHDEADARAAAAFAALYADHIRVEEDLVYPAARRDADAAGLAAMGAEMAARRRGG